MDPGAALTHQYIAGFDLLPRVNFDAAPLARAIPAVAR
jgi:hypothetical protein